MGRDWEEKGGQTVVMILNKQFPLPRKRKEKTLEVDIHMHPFNPFTL